MREHALLRKLQADLEPIENNYVLLKFGSLPMAADWTLDEIQPCESRTAAREIRSKFLARNPNRVVELWGRGADRVWHPIEPHGPNVIPNPGENVSPAQVPIGMYVGDGLRVWVVQTLREAGVPSAWGTMPCLVCYRDLGMPQPTANQYVNPGDILVGFTAASVLFIGNRKRADAMVEEAIKLNADLRAKVAAEKAKATSEH